MEYLPVELAKIIGRNRAEPEVQVNCILTQVVKAIAYMHSLGIAHMDIKVQNIGIDYMRRAKIFDFGSSQIILEKKFETSWITGV
ncbi:uncharacterized protein A1O9_11161 [Exophiala aquamarina CBS 119918]|uniref:Protein kinase domain-containing protein n=1 Tax=Exophiala aquamarina CBS 119918 TaxID=1182545 RepID=A0A072NXZ1_9EURO|nr:uncharacterized protein A1O9_11161 [Exophiala aquamarina CBS 119918]KEF52744.1 hypothetical protein A1O9_11161 [Exophiala aquamarina CBS 119918]